MRCACTQANVYVFVTNPERKLATSFTLGADGGDAKRTVSGKPFGLYGRFKILTAYGSLGWFIRSVGKDSSLRGGLKRGQRMMLNWRGFVCPSIFSKIGF